MPFHLSTQAAVAMAAFVLVSVVIGSYSVSGQWRSLATRFAAPADPQRGEKRFGFSSLRMTGGGLGGIYQGCVTIGVSERGISLALWAPMRLFHPALLIPWRAIESCERKTIGWHQAVQVTLRDGDGFLAFAKPADAIGEAWEVRRTV